MYFRLITCEVLAREVYLCAAHSRNIIDIELVEKGLHQKPEILRAELQRRIEETRDGVYDAILLGYGLCSNSVVGLVAPDTPLVVPRAHDCITLYLGSRDKYNAQFTAHPGTFYYTVDYIERGSDGSSEWAALGTGVDTDMEAVYEEYVEKYGKDNADYLMEVMGAWSQNYSRAAFIDMEVARFLGYDRKAQEQAERRGWVYERLEGSMALIKALTEGKWPEKDFLIVNPGQKVIATYDERIIDCTGEKSR